MYFSYKTYALLSMFLLEFITALGVSERCDPGNPNRGGETGT